MTSQAGLWPAALRLTARLRAHSVSNTWLCVLLDRVHSQGACHALPLGPHRSSLAHLGPRCPPHHPGHQFAEMGQEALDPRSQGRSAPACWGLALQSDAGNCSAQTSVGQGGAGGGLCRLLSADLGAGGGALLTAQCRPRAGFL